MNQDDMNKGCPSAKTMYEKACLEVATTQCDNVKTLLRQQQQQQQKFDQKYRVPTDKIRVIWSGNENTNQNSKIPTKFRQNSDTNKF
jgi:hypothetical protein